MAAVIGAFKKALPVYPAQIQQETCVIGQHDQAFAGLELSDQSAGPEQTQKIHAVA